MTRALISDMMWAARFIVREIMTPSRRRENPYLFMLIGIGHVMAGAVFSGGLFTSAVPIILRLSAAVIYWSIKERGDLAKGGSLKDGLLDSAFVFLGLLYDGPAAWPFLGIFLPWLAAVLRGRPDE